MKRPIAQGIGGEIPRHLAAWLNDDGVLARRVVAVSRHQLEEVAVDMDRMPHHAVVDEVDPHALILEKGDRLHRVGHLHAVERPHEALHVAGQVDVETALGRTHVTVAGQRHQIPVDEHLVAGISQPRAGLAGTIDRHRRYRLHAGALLDLGRLRKVAHLHGAHVHCAHAARTVAIHHRAAHHRHLAARHVHAHVPHRRKRARAERGNFCCYPGARSEGGTGQARSVYRLADERVGAIVGRGDDRVIGLGDADLKFVDVDGHDILPISLNDGELQARNADVERRHRRCVDDAQPHPLAGDEQRRPIVTRTMPVDEIRVSGTGRVGNIGGVHPHPAPIDAVLEPLILARKKAGERLALIIEMSGIDLHVAEDSFGAELAVVGKHDDVLAVRLHRIGVGRVDHDRPIMTELLLKTRMAVIPIGAVLLDRKLVEEARSSLDTGEGNARHTVILRRNEQAMPVDRAVLIQVVDDIQAHSLALAQADQGRGHRAVDADRLGCATVDHHRLTRDPERNVGAGHRRQRRRKPGRVGLRPRRQICRQCEASARQGSPS